MPTQTEEQIDKNLEDADVDDKTSESALDQSYFTSDGRSFFDPPIENYKKIYGSNTLSSSAGRALPDTGQS